MSVHPHRLKGRLSCAAVAAVLVALASSASAERKSVLVVDGTADGSGAEVVRVVEGQLAREPALGPVPIDLLVALNQPAPAAVSWQDPLTAALTEARADLARFDYRQAAEHAHGWLDRLAWVADIPAARKQLAELALIEGQALVGAGDVARAELTLRLMHRLDPGRTLDPARYLPEVVSAYLAAGRSAPPTAKLHITATAAAEILVDGVAVGPAPRDVDVAAGPHLIGARDEAIVTSGRRIDAPERQEIPVELTLVSAPLPVHVARVLTRLRAAADDDALADAVRTLLRLADAHDAVVVVRHDGGLATRIYTTARGRLGPPARDVGTPELTLAPLRPLIPPPPPPPFKPPPPVEPWYRQRWGKATIGLSVAAVVAGIVTAMVVRDPGDSMITGRPDVE